jgi:hypothetical protein
MTLADEALPPGPCELKGTAFFGETTKKAEAQAKAYLGRYEPVN